MPGSALNWQQPPARVLAPLVVAVASLSIWYLLRGEPLLVQGEVDATLGNGLRELGNEAAPAYKPGLQAWIERVDRHDREDERYAKRRISMHLPYIRTHEIYDKRMKRKQGIHVPDDERL